MTEIKRPCLIYEARTRECLDHQMAIDVWNMRHESTGVSP